MKKAVFILAFVVSLVGYTTVLFADIDRTPYGDFEMLDSIKEFGEQRYVKPLNTGFKTGPLKIHPTLRTKSAYDSNILRIPDDPRQDIVFNVMPGAIVEANLGKHQIVTGYEADFEFFTRDKSASQNDQNQNFFTLADLHFNSLYINVLEKLSETSSRSGTTFTERVPRIDQSINPKVGYKWKRATFEAGFRHFVRDYRRDVDDRFDFQNVDWTGVIYYDLFARLKALVEYQVSQIDYDDDFTRNGTFHQTRVGFEGEVLPNMTVKARVGPQFRNYNVSSEHDFYSWVGDLEVDYKVRENLKINAGVSRNAVEATFADVNFYKAHAIQVGVEYEILPKWVLFTGFTYDRHSYGERSIVGDRDGYRRDHRSTIRTGLRYEFREWMDVELAYVYARRDSNFSPFDYTENEISISTNLAY